MPRARGPVTLVTSISAQRNRWKDLAYAWKDVALRAADVCSECGAPALWHDTERGVFWCEIHWKSATADQTAGAEKVRW